MDNKIHIQGLVDLACSALEAMLKTESHAALERFLHDRDPNVESVEVIIACIIRSGFCPVPIAKRDDLIDRFKEYVSFFPEHEPLLKYIK